MSDLFFLLSKTIWALARPDTLLLVLLGVGWALLGRRPRLGRRMIGTALALLLLIGGLPLHSVLLRPLEQRFAIEPSVGAVAGILILGGGEDVRASELSGTPQTNQAGDRFLTGLALARRFPQAPVLFTGGAARFRHQGQESRIAARLLEQGGVALDRLTVEDRSRNTAENARFSRALVLAQARPQTGAWLLVTSAFHMPRALGSFCAAGWTDLVPWPTDFRAEPVRWRWNPAGHLDQLNTAAKEWLGLLAYRLTGRSDRLVPTGCPPLETAVR